MVEKVSRAYVLGMKIIAANIVIPVILALATNGLIFALGWQQPDRDIQPAFAPPGYVIGIVWTVLFALMGCARGLASRQGDRRTVRLLTILIGLCLAYPFYTLGLQDNLVGLVGIVLTGAFCLYVIVSAWARTRAAALLLLPLAGWFCFAGVLVLAVLRLNP